MVSKIKNRRAHQRIKARGSVGHKSNEIIIWLELREFGRRFHPRPASKPNEETWRYIAALGLERRDSRCVYASQLVAREREREFKEQVIVALPFCCIAQFILSNPIGIGKNEKGGKYTLRDG